MFDTKFLLELITTELAQPKPVERMIDYYIHLHSDTPLSWVQIQNQDKVDFIIMRKMTRNNTEGRKGMRNQWIISEAL